MAQGHTGDRLIPIRGSEKSKISFHRFSIEAKRGVELRHSTRNASSILYTRYNEAETKPHIQYLLRNPIQYVNKRSSQLRYNTPSE